jgi:hypothetical protein
MINLRRVKRRNHNNNTSIIKLTLLMVGFMALLVVVSSFKDSYVHDNDNIITTMLTTQVYEHPLEKINNELVEENKVKEYEIEQIRLEYQESFKKIESLEYDKKKLAERYPQKTILDFSKLTNNEPMYLVDMIIREWERHGGTDSLVPLAICKYESNFKPTTRFKGSTSNPEDSWGLFQVNVHDKAHASRMGWSNYERLYDPVFNVQYQFPELVAYERKGIAKGLSGYELAQYVSRYGQRPYWTNSLAETVKNNYNYFVKAKIKG